MTVSSFGPRFVRNAVGVCPLAGVGPVAVPRAVKGVLGAEGGRREAGVVGGGGGW